MIRFPLAALTPILLLAACGRTEPVSDLPDQEKLAAAADEAAAKALGNQQSEAEPPIRTYSNSIHGFSATFPEGWVMDKGASNEDGVVYEDPGAGADVRIFWQPNGQDQTLQQIVEALSDGAEGVDGDFIGGNEYRGTANDGEGNNVAVRLLKKSDGSIVTATFVYPEMLSEQYRPLSKQVLDSLRLTDAQSVEATLPAPAANAAQ